MHTRPFSTRRLGTAFSVLLIAVFLDACSNLPRQDGSDFRDYGMEDITPPPAEQSSNVQGMANGNLIY